jgi:hypothetical protein
MITSYIASPRGSRLSASPERLIWILSPIPQVFFMSKRTISTTTRINQEAGIIPSRPKLPSTYGIPKNSKNLLPWSYIRERMTKAMHYWICTVTPDQRPHATPVDGLWLDDRLYFGGSPETRWRRNLEANPAIDVHLESAIDLVILRGDARYLTSPSSALATTLSKASAAKYGYAPKPEEYEARGAFVFRPRVVLAWKQFPKDVTRWQFEHDD